MAFNRCTSWLPGSYQSPLGSFCFPSPFPPTKQHLGSWKALLTLILYPCFCPLSPGLSLGLHWLLLLTAPSSSQLVAYLQACVLDQVLHARFLVSESELRQPCI